MNSFIKKLIKGVEKDGQKKIIKFVESILHLYNLKTEQVEISREKVKPEEIWVAFVEESRLDEAKWLAENKYRSKLPPSVVLIQYKNKKVIFAGSNRSLVFLLKRKNPDCLVVKLPNDLKEPKIIKEAKTTLNKIFKGVK